MCHLGIKNKSAIDNYTLVEFHRTSEEQLKEYLRSFGEMVKAVIMKYHTIGRAGGFCFVVFADPMVVIERVTKQTHNIDIMMVISVNLKINNFIVMYNVRLHLYS